MEMSGDGTCSVHEIELADGSKVPVFWLIPDPDAASSPQGMSLVCHVGQIVQIVNDLRGAGVTIVSETTLRPGTAIPSAIIEDPDGHKILLCGN
jgi:hypothetical protein